MADSSARGRRSARKASAAPPPPPPAAPTHSPLAWLGARPARVALALAALHGVLALVAFNPSPFAGGDNAAYMALARSLAERHSYLSLWEPTAPAHTQYPPVWPAILALLWSVGLRGWIVMKATTVVFSVAAVAFSYLWLRRTTSAGIALGAGLLLAVSPGVLELSHVELSDAPAWAFTMLALWASTHVAGSPERERLADERRHGRWLAVMVAAAVLGNFTRAAGLPLVVAAFAWLALRRRGRDLAILAAAFLPAFFLWWLWGKLHGGAGYLGYLWAVDPYQPKLGSAGALGMVNRVVVNAQRYAALHLPVLLSWSTGRHYLQGVPVFLLAIAGWARRARKPGLAEVWTPLYVGLLLLWPSTWSGERFLLPLLPLLFCYAGEALRDGARRVAGPTAGRLVPLAAAAVLLLVMLPGIAGVERAGRACSREFAAGDPFPCMAPEYHDLLTLAAMTKGALPPGSAVLSRKATLFYAISGYPGATYPLSADPDTFFAFARRTGAHFVAYDQISDLAPLYLHPVLLARRDDFCVVPGLSLPGAALLRIEPGSPRRAGVAENSFRQCAMH